jgi:hypothetical protein
MEKWIDCYGWEGFYKISNYGNVKSLSRTLKTSLGYAVKKEKLLKKIIASTGYEVVNLSKNNVKRQQLVHRLVLLSFVGVPTIPMQACHGNGVRNDNRLENLRWGDAKDNSKDRKAHGTHIFGEDSPNAKLSEVQAFEIKSSKKPVRELSRNYGVSRAAIKAIKTNKNWAHIP